MGTHRIASLLLLLAVAVPTIPLTAQGIPDHIPDEPGKSPADRQEERLAERYRGFVGRLFADGSLAVAPVADPAYQVDLGLGIRVHEGDALLLHVGARRAPQVTSGSDALVIEPGATDVAWMVGVGYELRGIRFLGETPTGWRSALDFGGGVMVSPDLTSAFFEVGPKYAVLTGSTWSVPVGLRLSLVTTDGRDLDTRLTRAFLGIEIGVRWHLMRRDRLD